MADEFIAEFRRDPPLQFFDRVRGKLDHLARIDIEKDGRGDDRNVIHTVIEPDHPQYAKVMGVPAKTAPGGQSVPPAASAAPSVSQPPAPAAAPAVNTGATGKPAWAQ